jgi:hypothetical protein
MKPKVLSTIFNMTIPKTREKSIWTAENKCGVLLGIIEFGFVQETE